MSFVVTALIVGLAAFISLSYEILWYRAIAFVSGDPASAFGLLLAYYLAGLAGGALVVGSICRRRGQASGSPWLGVAFFIAAANVIGYSLGPLLGWLAQAGSWPVIFPGVALAAAGLGGIFPLMTHYAVPPDARAGSRMSYLYTANILGAASGSLLTGYVLLDILPLRSVALLLALFGLGIAFVVLLRHSPRGPWVGIVGGGILVAAAAIGLVHRTVFDRLFEKLLYKQELRADTRFAHTVENRVGVVGVTKRQEVFAGGVYDGMILTDPAADLNGILRAYAVSGMHPQPRRILIIGMSTGAWAQVLAHAPGLEQMTIVEINPGYLELIAEYPEVSSLLSNPKVKIVIDDGRRWLRRHPSERFDVIVANTTFNWRSHSTNLLSSEFLETIRSHLAPAGIYYFNTTGSAHAVKTALTVFPHGLRIRNFVAVGDSPIELNRERWAGALAAWTIDGRPVLDAAGPRGHRTLQAVASDSLVLWQDRPEVEDGAAALASAGQGRVITDDNMATEWEQVFPSLWLPSSDEDSITAR